MPPHHIGSINMTLTIDEMEDESEESKGAPMPYTQRVLSEDESSIQRSSVPTVVVHRGRVSEVSSDTTVNVNESAV
jgi:hypothetical protein